MSSKEFRSLDSFPDLSSRPIFSSLISKKFNKKSCSGLIEKVNRGASRALEEGGDFLEVVAMPLYFHRNIQKL